MIETLSQFLTKFLNIGGVAQIKLIDDETSLKVSLAYYLSSCICEKSTFE